MYKVSNTPKTKKTKLKHFIDIPPLTKVEEVCVWNLKGKGVLSVYHNLLMLPSKDSAVDKLEAWRRDVQEDKDEKAAI